MMLSPLPFQISVSNDLLTSVTSQSRRLGGGWASQQTGFLPLPYPALSRQEETMISLLLPAGCEGSLPTNPDLKLEHWSYDARIAKLLQYGSKVPDPEKDSSYQTVKLINFIIYNDNINKNRIEMEYTPPKKNSTGEIFWHFTLHHYNVKNSDLGKYEHFKKRITVFYTTSKEQSLKWGA